MFFSRSSSFGALLFPSEESWDVLEEDLSSSFFVEEELASSFVDDEDLEPSFFVEEELASFFFDDEDLASVFFDDEDLAVSFFEDEDLASPLEDELSWDSEDSSIEVFAEVDELSSPHAANRNAEEIKKGRIFL